MSDAERDRTGTKKAKDWDGLEQIDKRDIVCVPKVHDLSFLRGWGSMYDKVRLMLYWSYSVAVHAPTSRANTTTGTGGQGDWTR